MSRTYNRYLILSVECNEEVVLGPYLKESFSTIFEGCPETFNFKK